MAKTAGTRYATRRGERESQFTIHIREMIEMIKNEEVKTSLYVKGIKLSKHAMERVEQHFSVSNLATATKMIKDMLGKATRIGAILAFDGRINVLYAYDKTAIFLSPDLKTVVTINKYEDVTYEPLATHIREKKLDRDEAIRLHLEYLNNIDEQEKRLMDSMLKIESLVREANDLFQTILEVGKGRRRKRNIKQMISEHNMTLKQEGKKLFELKVDKRHVYKSLVALY